MRTAQKWSHVQRGRLFEEIPCGIVVIDRALNVVDHNHAFAQVFGEARGRQCFAAIRGRTAPCQDCPAEKTFADAKPRVREQTGQDVDGRPSHHLMQITPIVEPSGEVEFVVATAADLSATKRLQREYQTLFEKVPCYVAVINRDYRVVKANEMFRRVFGEPTGEHCYSLFKRRQQQCESCPAEMTFRDEKSHTSQHVGVTLEGEPSHYVVSTAPLLQAEGRTSHVIEMALDVTEIHRLEEKLSQENRLRETLVESSLDAIVVLDRNRRVMIFNRAAEELWGYERAEVVGHRVPTHMVPTPLRELLSGDGEHCVLHEIDVTTASGATVPVRLAAVRLRWDSQVVGAAVIAQDLREIKQLEREKLDAERLAAVGQTVAGLAHGIKNILTGLEGGMYVAGTGMKRGDEARLRQGWEMLERNMGRISALVKNLLAFSRGDKARVSLVEPTVVAREVVELFRDSAEQHGVTLETSVSHALAPMPADSEGLHSCLANLISNALDACLVSHNPSCRVRVSVSETDDVVSFEVTDTGCGMDYEVKQKAFTSFFSTKGAGGTGIGLLLTRKIVQQHGGTIAFESAPGQGTTFRLSFPRARLPKPTGDEVRDDG
jgi:PAS domain S-box-containing protein